ncbi:MAG: hypothetical protein HOB84_01645 [Candidatus Marinimicrobia bacterium]|jgi:glycine cleavage system H lipoate-binding protein|nr:hypothetical protein [Candidatus Neomarinimicrobiota bacterium]MBT4362612.1 hypothetical protein [Candidatus Neomarinimicrobiota bacterium]MBT4713457.1 hypothetical protein [Candidatus Neomarinimicrobiota bacterium]MBT4944627.1 hypothetical protein [Candidatus Neomarinimicrobiota bacterium]MBT5270689.1 hypothetical protein [Candidatus Neomarinimicrobiota bacterium]
METHKCIWMDAESVDYQLCPLNQNCDLCDFHKQMMRGCRPGKTAESTTIDIRKPEATVIQFTPGLQFLNRHFWIKRTGKGKVHLGIDAFLFQILSSVQKIITPKNNSLLVQRQCFAWLQLEDEIIYLRTPIPGRIIHTNPLFDSKQMQDTQLYLSPEEDLWLLELELDEGSLEIEFLCKDDYMNQAKKDIGRFDKLLEPAKEATPHTLIRRSQLDKKAFSKYLLDVSDNLAYVC